VSTNEIVSTHRDYKPEAFDVADSHEIFYHFDNDFSVSVRLHHDDSAFLVWSDGINEWIEHYERLSQAFGRLAVLQACAESAWKKAFASNPETFARQFDGFVLGTAG